VKISNETKVGVLAAVGIALLFIGFNYLKGVNVFDKGEDYYVLYANSSGLAGGDPVEIDGYTVGKVKNVALQKDQSGVEVILNMHRSNLHSNTRTRLLRLFRHYQLFRYHCRLQILYLNRTKEFQY
jgi:ABC-type transporter Mla subunit MlaD